MIIKKKDRNTGTTIRVWLETRAKLKAIAKHYKVPMTRLLDSICDNIIAVNEITIDK